jgi:hypothetical protein
MKPSQLFFAIGVSVIAIAAPGCAKSDDDGGNSTGTGGMTATGGVLGTGGMVAAGTGGVIGAGTGGTPAAGTGGTPVMGTGGVTGAAGMGAGQAVTFAKVYSDVIVGTGCLAGIACHSQPAGNLRMSDQMSAYMNLVGVMAMGMNTMGGMTNCVDSGLMRVKAGDPDNSLLVQKVSGSPPCGIAMPPGGMVKPENLMLLRTWIQNGANND